MKEQRLAEYELDHLRPPSSVSPLPSPPVPAFRLFSDNHTFRSLEKAFLAFRRLSFPGDLFFQLF